MLTAIALILLSLYALHLVVHYRAVLTGYARLAPAAEGFARPSVSVIIPARNEARDLGATIESLQRQQGVDLELLVVDDHSVDETAAVARRYAVADPRVRVLAAPPLPTGWLGKPHAQAYGAAHATHPLLLFADADVRFSPTAVCSAVNELERRHVDLLTLIPAVELGTFWERAVQPVMAALIVYGVSFAKVNDPADPQSVGVGAFMLVRRSAYDRAGGHAAIRDRIVDDYALAQAIKRTGGPVWLADGRDVVAIRMYHSLGELWRGWSKNLYEGLKLPLWIRALGRDWYVLGDRPLLVLGLLCLHLGATFVLPAIMPVWTVAADAGLLATAAAWTLFLTFALGWSRLCRSIGIGRAWALALPLGAVVVALIALNSAWSARFGGGLVWRGRRYAVGRS